MTHFLINFCNCARVIIILSLCIPILSLSKDAFPSVFIEKMHFVCSGMLIKLHSESGEKKCAVRTTSSSIRPRRLVPASVSLKLGPVAHVAPIVIRVGFGSPCRTAHPAGPTRGVLTLDYFSQRRPGELSW
jgi:hypothetical protein